MKQILHMNVYYSLIALMPRYDIGNNKTTIITKDNKWKIMNLSGYACSMNFIFKYSHKI